MKEKIYKYLDEKGANIIKNVALYQLEKKFKLSKLEIVKYYDEWRAEWLRGKR